MDQQILDGAVVASEKDWKLALMLFRHLLIREVSSRVTKVLYLGLLTFGKLKT